MRQRSSAKKRLMAWLCAIVICCVACFSNIGMVYADDTIYVDRKADVVFVIDGTGSMGSYISSVKTNLTTFINLLDAEDVDVRVGFVVYRDITCGEDTICSAWYENVTDAIAYLDGVSATGGGDADETLVDGFGCMFDHFTFRSDAVNFGIVLTDADTKDDTSYGLSRTQILRKLKTDRINTSVITRTSLYDAYAEYVTDGTGILGDISGDYSILLKEIALDVIVDGVSGLVVNDIYPTSGLIGEKNLVTVKATGVTAEDGFTVTVGGKNVVNLTRTEDGFTFETPTDLPKGMHDIVVVNGSGAKGKNIGTYTVCETEAERDYTVLNITPTTSVVGKAKTVKVTVDKITYADDFSVKVGDVEAKVTDTSHDNYFSFELPLTLDAGKYDIVVTNTKEKTIGRYTVTPREASDYIKIDTVSRYSSMEGKAVAVKITFAKNITYTDDFAITLGGVPATINESLKKPGYVYCTLPDTVPAGIHSLMVYNGGQFDAVSYTVTAKPLPDPIQIKEISRDNSQEGKAVSIKITFVKDVTYADDFAITLGGVPATVNESLKKPGYVYCTLPTTLAAGNYDLVVSNGGQTASIAYTVTAKPLPDPIQIKEISRDNSQEGKTVSVKITFVKDVTYAGDFAITLGGVPATVNESLKKPGYVYCTLPATLAAGSYDLVVSNGGQTASIAYTVTAKPLPDPIQIKEISRDNSQEGKAVSVKIIFVKDVTYADDFAITLGGVPATVNESLKKPGYVYCTLPTTLAAGSYDLVVSNGGQTASIAYTVTAKPLPDPIQIKELSRESNRAGRETAIKITFVKNVTYADDFSIQIGGVATTVSDGLKKPEYVYCTIPGTLPVGVYELVVTNGGQTASWTYTITP